MGKLILAQYRDFEGSTAKGVELSRDLFERKVYQLNAVYGSRDLAAVRTSDAMLRLHRGTLLPRYTSSLLNTPEGPYEANGAAPALSEDTTDYVDTLMATVGERNIAVVTSSIVMDGLAGHFALERGIVPNKVSDSTTGQVNAYIFNAQPAQLAQAA